ncbi:MAG: hypothetical protein AMJ62_11400 [Myxococcales bacterium SG8_38]|nr:MAG: hypothetical protein AMJ62_11400 [Myxococcales bacterium SG8_38]
MGDGEEKRLRRGDLRFLMRICGAVALVVLLAVLVLGVLDRSRLGSCAARGFLEVTETPSSD